MQVPAQSMRGRWALVAGMAVAVLIMLVLWVVQLQAMFARRAEDAVESAKGDAASVQEGLEYSQKMREELNLKPPNMNQFLQGLRGAVGVDDAKRKALEAAGQNMKQELSNEESQSMYGETDNE